MNITTKYNIGDTVFGFDTSSGITLRRFVISHINITINSDLKVQSKDDFADNYTIQSVIFYGSMGRAYREDEVFLTKEELMSTIKESE